MIKETEDALAAVVGRGADKVLTVKVAKHKTGSTERATVGCSGELLQQLEHWVDIRWRLIPDSHLVFPMWEGNGPIVHFTSRVRDFAEKVGIQLPTTQTL